MWTHDITNSKTNISIQVLALTCFFFGDRFFLMHLINKPDTEYTGQETYVWNMYQQRCWDFFPVGDCFRKQYDELGGGGG